MPNIKRWLLLPSACVCAAAAVAQTTPSTEPQSTPQGTTQTVSGNTSSTCLAQQKGLEAELATIRAMTSASAGNQQTTAKAQGPTKKKSKIEKVAKAVAGAAADVLLPNAVRTVATAGAEAMKGKDKSADADTTQSAPAKTTEGATPVAPAAEVPALLARQQEVERRLAAIKQGTCTP